MLKTKNLRDEGKVSTICELGIGTISLPYDFGHTASDIVKAKINGA